MYTLSKSDVRSFHSACRHLAPPYASNRSSVDILLCKETDSLDPLSQSRSQLVARGLFSPSIIDVRRPRRVHRQILGERKPFAGHGTTCRAAHGHRRSSHRVEYRSRDVQASVQVRSFVV